MILPLHAGNPGDMTGSGNWTYFFPGAYPVLIDAGVGQSAHLEALANADEEGPRHVLVTHAHGDHISGAAAIAARWGSTRFSKWPWPGRDEQHQVLWSRLADGDIVAAGDTELQVVYTPGHAPDHLCFWHPASRTVLSGDLVVRGTTVVIPATMGGSLADYLHSLRRVRSLRPVRLLPAHGEPIDNPDGIIEQYLEHRRHREAQVLAAVEGGLHRIDDMVARIYLGLAAPLVPMARESVLAHLHKLEHEGLVRTVGNEWTALS